MYNFYPYFTNDGSVGLFSPTDDDIYHSTMGAATEAYEKFIFPADFEKIFSSHSEIKILDICYGIGYNSKSFLKFFSEKFLKNSVYTTKILSEYNYKIHTDKNRPFDIYIKSIDTDKILTFLSPFITSKKRKNKNYKLPFKNEKIEKYLTRKSDVNKEVELLIKYPDELNMILLDKIIENHPEILRNEDINSILKNRKFKEYFNPSICSLFDFYKFREGIYTPRTYLKGLLHNIYYKYLSNRYKRAMNSLLNKNFTFEPKINDARQELIEDKNRYNFVFLDAFTPAKCPCLWTVDFFKLLFEHLEDDGMILTYSNSASVRNAFLNAGFFVGKILNKTSNKFTGTIAVKNKALIKNELSEYDLGLMKTRAGIFYRDENLNALNEAIIARHKLEVENSPFMSSSKFIKNYR